jgi:hypothetical protein
MLRNHGGVDEKRAIERHDKSKPLSVEFASGKLHGCGFSVGRRMGHSDRNLRIRFH